ncbi:pitrilysin family protein [uncultured Erythrobacter sp.]|uniref:M16 family metallopeptidase n=1 Tax=uncultured Erythrobacter sp. TaxID=263913 RepID=UPI00260294B6|nr:insulinase family protein [uncultured Erythrobacter sp.]
MSLFSKGAKALCLLAAPAAFILPASAQDVEPNGPPRTSVPATAPQIPAPQNLQSGDEVPWLYENSNVPVDREWLFGEMDNGLRYAVRKNGVPPGQVSIRVRIDAGSLHERDFEQGYAHLLEHLLFRESKYLGQAKAIETWQRLGATFGSDANAETSPTHTAYKLDLPGVTRAKLYESFKLLSGMVRAPVLSDENVAAELPIVLAEKRERGGAAQRVGEFTRAKLFAGQRLATRTPIGTVETLQGADGAKVSEFYRRWYRPENTVIVVVGDAPPEELAGLVEKWFGDWQAEGEGVAAPDFGDPVAPADAQPSNDPSGPVGEIGVLVEPDLPRSLTYAVMRPWRKVDDTIVYNEGLMIEAVAQSIINRRLESRARSGGSYLYAQVQQDDVSRSTDATFVTFAPLSDDWNSAAADVRGVIADALASAPTQEEIDREVAEFDIAFANQVEQRTVISGSDLADTLISAVDIRETTASPEVVLQVFRDTKPRFTPEEVLAHTRKLFTGDVVRGVYVTPASGEADESALRLALGREVTGDGSSRLAASTISFDELPPVGEPGVVANREEIGLLDVEQVDFGNGVKTLLWSNNAEPGRVVVKVRFGAGYRAFDADDAAYAALGNTALVGSGLGELGQEELDRLATGRKLGFDFAIEDAVFTFTGRTRSSDVADQLYLFAAKLGMPRWDKDPVIRARAAAELAYNTYATSPSGVLNRDLTYLMTNGDARFATPGPDALKQVTPEGFREVWEPLLAQGPVEVLVFGEFDKEATVEALRNTFGALAPRSAIPAEIAARVPQFPVDSGETTVLNHRGDTNQAAAVIAWPSGAGVESLRESRQLQILIDVFNNRLLEALRERAGASYAPQIYSDWPVDLESGGTITALAQLQPKDVSVFFAEADKIARDLVNTPPTTEELDRVTEPLRQLFSRASTGNTFWLFQLEGATTDRRRVELLRSLLADYSNTTPQIMQFLAGRYFGQRPGWRLAVIPEGAELSEALPSAAPTAASAPASAPRNEVIGR